LVSFDRIFLFLKIPAIGRTNLSRRTRNAASQRYARASQTDDRRDTRNEVERNRWNRNRQQRNVAFNPYRAAFSYDVEIDYSSQRIVAIGPMNVVCHLSLKMKPLDCVARAVESN